ncbi:MAG TPA: DUF1579 domain-containing protein [Blastocatellia bacterium]|nr:DUF1579 domain-containing protein [Blastocatellia bacterium]
MLFAKINLSADSPVQEGRSDFDFLAGRWTVRHRRLKRRLVEDDHWEEFGGLCESRPVIGGLGNIDDNIIEVPSGTYRAATLRLFDHNKARWSIWWVDSRTMQLEPPVHGCFNNGVGTFFGHDLLDDCPIRVRFIWSDITAVSARWEQSFSRDAGATWEVNWIMNFSRMD